MIKYTGGYTKCPKCGSNDLSTGHDPLQQDFSIANRKERLRKAFNSLKWYHKCTKCGNKIYFKNMKKIKEGTGKEFDKILLWIEDIVTDIPEIEDRVLIKKMIQKFNISPKEAEEYYERYKMQYHRMQEDEKIIYRGGHHIVICDGEDHWREFEDGTREFAGKCKNWFGKHEKGSKDEKNKTLKEAIRSLVQEWMGGITGIPNFNAICPKCDMPINACKCAEEEDKEKNQKAKLPKGLKYMAEEKVTVRLLKKMIKEALQNWSENIPVQVVTENNVELFKNFKQAKEKYPSLDPIHGCKKFTWAIKSKVHGHPVMRFESWNVFKRLWQNSYRGKIK